MDALHVLITDLRIQPLCPRQLRASRTRLQVGTRGPFSPVLRFNMDAHLQGAAALHAPLSYKQHVNVIFYRKSSPVNPFAMLYIVI